MVCRRILSSVHKLHFNGGFCSIADWFALLYIEQDKSLVTVFERRDEDGRWSSIDYNSLDQAFTIEGNLVSLADIYENVLKA